MTAHDLIQQADISVVWTALGGDSLRHGRGKAFWRDGDGYNVALDRNRGIWHDHARGEGGGIIALIRRVLGCEKSDAVQWLANHEGAELDDNRMSPEERRAWAERQSWARTEAQKLAEWRQDYLANLRAKRNALWDTGRQATRLGHELLVDGRHDSPLWAVVWKHCIDDLEGDRFDAEIERIKAMDWRDVMTLRECVTGEGVTV